MTPQFVESLVRGALLGLGTFLFAFLTTWSQVDDLRAAIIGGGIAALAALGIRGGEGIYDSHRAKTGNVKPSDVGAYSEPLKK